MAGERQLLEDGEDADLATFPALGLGVARQDERGLAEIGLARQLLHLVVGQATGIGEDGELVALQRVRGEDVELDKREFALTHGSDSSSNLAGARGREERQDGQG